MIQVLHMFEWLKRHLDKIGSPTLDWVQVEVTTRCNASCTHCPHSLIGSQWRGMDMPLKLFCELVPFLRYTDLVYLQGWGEPLVNKDIFEMIRICKDRGKRVGFTTNGMLLTEETLQTLVDLQLDIIGISLAGTTPRTHNQIRKGTDFNKLISEIERLRKIKAQKKTEAPAVHLAYLMLKSNFCELKEILSIANRVEAKQIVASNLTLIVDPELCPEAIFHDAQHMDYYRSTLDEIRQRAAREDIIFDYHGPGLDDASLGCRENVYQACVINVEGEVVPCVFTNPVLCGDRKLSGGKPCRYFFKDQSLPLRSMSFGNIQNESLTRIWNKEQYCRFREIFDPEAGISRRQVWSRMPQCCLACYKGLGA